jgi:hypothetical protein
VTPLNPSATGFTWSNARACAERCAAAYQTSTISAPSTDTQALIADEGLCITVAFRGTSSVRDWIEDCEFHKEPLAWEQDDAAAEVHDGFLKAFDSVLEDVKHQVDTFVAAGRRPVFITGHSLGGALAILCALEMYRQSVPIAGVYTFGQPRVGNKIFQNIYDAVLFEETFRVVNQNDIVPRVPGVLMGYHHCGQEIFLPIGGGWSLNPPLWTKLLSDALGLWGAYRNRQDVLITEHLMAAYQRRIQLLQDAPSISDLRTPISKSEAPEPKTAKDTHHDPR